MLLGSGIQAGCGFIHQQHGWVIEYGSGQGHGLPLAPGQRVAAFTYLLIQAFRFHIGKQVDPGKLYRSDQLVLGDLTGAEENIVSDRTVEQGDILW